MTTQRSIRVGACQYPIEPVNSVTGWINKMDRWLTEADLARVDLAVLPEYAALELMSTISREPEEDFASQLRRAAPLLEQYPSLCQDLAVRHDLWLLSGTCPTPLGGAYHNRAWLCSPTGNCEAVDKLQMTSFERRWGIVSGASGRVFQTPLGSIGVAICYDSEFPLIARKLVQAGAELILVPSCTDTIAGSERVRIACRARALENQCYVLQAVTLGAAPWVLALDESHGRAGVFCPPQVGLSDHGVVAEGQFDEPGWVFADLDLDRLAEVRNSGPMRNYLDWDSDAHLASDATSTVLG